MTRILLLVSALLLSVSPQAAAIQIGNILQLQDLGAGVKPKAINNNGQIVGQDATGQAFLWENGTMLNLGTLGGPQSYANDINDNGTVVGWSLDDNGLQKAFRYDRAVGAMFNIDPDTTFSSSAEAINLHGDVVGWKNNGVVSRSSIWSESRPNGLLVFGGGNHRAFGINDAGQVVGVAYNSVSGNPEQGYYWDPVDPIAGISGGLGTNYFPYAGINNAGFTGGISNDLASYMNIDNSFSRSIGLLDDHDPISSILGLNDQGLLVGYSGLNALAYDLSTDTMMNMNDFLKTGFEVDGILRITDINNNGQFVGIASFNGVEHGFSGQAVAIPEPSGLAVAAIGLLPVFSSFALRGARGRG